MPKALCAAFNCRNTGDYTRPKDIKLRKLWEESLNKTNALPLTWSRPSLCAEHFIPDGYLRYEQTGGTTDGQASATESSESDSEPNKGYKCNACMKQFNTLCLQFRHQITHEHYCAVCRRSFINRQGFCSHICRVCDVCNKCFTRKTGLIKHKKVCQLKRNRSKHEEMCRHCLTCADCSETFATPALLRQHIVEVGLFIGTFKKKHEKVEHTSPFCGERFKNKFDLVSHMRKHSAPVRSYSRAKRQLTGAVDRIINRTDSKMEIDATSPKLQIIQLEDIKKELEERLSDVKQEPLEEDTQVIRETDPLNMGPQAERLQTSYAIVQRICSDWSDDKVELVELERVKQEPEES